MKLIVSEMLYLVAGVKMKHEKTKTLLVKCATKCVTVKVIWMLRHPDS